MKIYRASAFFNVFLGLMLVWANAAMADTLLVGDWKGKDSAVSLDIKADGTYRYRLNVLDISGKWTTEGDQLTLNYSLMGLKKKKVSRYRFDGKDLLLKSDDRPEMRLVK
ncbi:MAG TPA: hypothetical protein ENK78_01235 [Thiothrix sp.]|nr:hypothetical protein [Thiothrix sp.]